MRLHRVFQNELAIIFAGLPKVVTTAQSEKTKGNGKFHIHEVKTAARLLQRLGEYFTDISDELTYAFM